MGDIVGWITINGAHVPIMEGQSKEEARSEFIKKSVDRDLEKKDQDIAKAKREAEKTEADKSGKTIPNKVDQDKFPSKIQAAKDACAEESRWRVDVHTKEEYAEKGAKCYSTPGGSVVAVTKDGDIISVCKMTGDSASGRDLLEHAVKNGGVKLDSFSGNHGFYTRCGFEPVSWTPFNKEYAPDGWAKSGAGEEPVIFYQYVGVGNVKYTNLGDFLTSVKPYTGDSGYDDAMAYRDSKLKK